MLKSIRWRLPMSYAGIALLTTLVLGLVLLTTLHSYYAQQELNYLNGNARTISEIAAHMLQDNTPIQSIQAQAGSLSFLSQAHVRLLDADHQLIADSGVPNQRQVFLSSVPVIEPFSPGLPVPDPGPMPYAARIVIRSTTTDTTAISNNGRSNMGSIDVFKRAFFIPSLPAADTGAGLVMGGTAYRYDVQEETPVADQRSDQHVEVTVLDDYGKTLGYVELSDGPAYGLAILNSVTRGWAIASAAAILLAVGVGWLISRGMSVPLLALANVTTRMAHGNLSARANVKRTDEIGALARSFNHMASRVEETVLTLRRFVADAAHELHTPLTALTTNLELAATEDDDQKRLTFILRAQEQLKRLELLTSGLLDLARIETGGAREEKCPVDLCELIRETSELYASRAEQAGLNFAIDLPAVSISVNANGTQLRRVIGNLLDNAIKFTSEGGTITIGLRRAANGIEVWVQDTGVGVPPEDLPLLFNRFHRGRNAAAYPGSGLGLAISKAIVESHSGHILVERHDPGTCFTLRLPAVS